MSVNLSPPPPLVRPQAAAQMVSMPPVGVARRVPRRDGGVLRDFGGYGGRLTGGDEVLRPARPSHRVSPATSGKKPMIQRELHDRMANAIRGLAIDGVEAAKSGHPGMPMGMADVATVLFTRFL